MSKKGKKEETELQASQSHLNHWEDEEKNNSGKHFQSHLRQEGAWEKSAWVYEQEIMLGQADKLLWWDDCLGEWVITAGIYFDLSNLSFQQYLP